MRTSRISIFIAFILCISIFASILPYLVELQDISDDPATVLATATKTSPTSSIKLPHISASHTNVTTLSLTSHMQSSLLPKRLTIFTNQTLSEICQYNELNAGEINATRLSTTWQLMNLTTRDQKVYFSITFNNTVPSYVILLLSSPTGQVPNLLQSFTSQHEIDGNFVINVEGTWNLTVEVNSDLPTNTTISPSYYNLSVYLPKNGYSFDTAIGIANVANESVSLYNYSTKFKYETIYFSISVHANQRFLLNITAGLTSALDGAFVSLYRPGPFSPYPLLSDVPSQNGEIILTWVPDISGVMWIVISQGNIIGNYTMIFSAQTFGYSFDSAILITPNQTYLQWVNFTDQWPTILYYTLFVNQTDTTVNVNISEKDQGSLILNNAAVTLYTPNENFKVLQLYEQDSPITGQITGNFTTTSTGYYYIVIQLNTATNRFNSKEAYGITVLYTYPHSFQWTLVNFLITFLILFIIPLVFLGIDLFIKPDPVQWNILLSCEAIYNAISKNPRFEKKNEVPAQRILLEPPYIGRYLLKFDEINEAETSLSLIGSDKSFLRYFYYLPIGVFAYFLINYLLFLSTTTTLLWFKVTNLFPFYELLIICFILVIPISAFIISRYNFIRRLIYEINYTKDDLALITETPNLSLNVNALQRQLSYVRVVWNQAKKAFNEQNYSLFIIKADTAVKKLVETRYVQLIGSIESMDFNKIIEELRIRGFDIPSNKKIEYFHKIRNKVVHTSHLLLDEKTAVETFNYYSKFLNRLGIRT